ncbi:hypothetical protein F383_27396 [Gossypium arboreum]|uniref:Uncharacterized protein n=2 Tax=Gossypium arboreum TaxID=29729 RepID=A0A0B0MN16_GOSAR|nr:hypothetical protein F383_39352 [Gossypium arboreum]KHG13126.1 hypothetical protein F383_38545 [Gossypium arboreum]KHG18432.1 hypothetical protein F383_23839 [Gossypium arboreum]KHG18970.1 hypothetical protein F383_24578 [Gossypium arboreum]KHG21985.1 hypothetical protein F383_27396 [Gossypium arboreum]
MIMRLALSVRVQIV